MLLGPGPGGKTGLIELEHHVLQLRKFLPAGPTESGGYREKDLVQFVAKNGGTRTVPVADLTMM